MTPNASGTFRTFAYGSNMLSVRLRGRSASAPLLGVARLSGHELRWQKHSTDGSGKCDVLPAHIDHAVFGVGFEIDMNEKPALDQAEGLGNGYGLKYATGMLNGLVFAASIYFAIKADPGLKPYSWYRALVVTGAKEHGLPTPYIASVEAIEAPEDPNPALRDRNMRIASSGDPLDGDQA